MAFHSCAGEAAVYLPAAFREENLAVLHAVIHAARLGQFVTATAKGLLATPLPLLLDPNDGERGVLYGHVAKGNSQWREKVLGDGLAVFLGEHAYVTPSWYASKQRDGKVVPTWNYVAVNAYGPVEFFEDATRLLELVTRLTQRHESSRAAPWSVDDAPADFVQTQLRGIVGIRMPIVRLEGKRKLSQNRNAEDRHGVREGLAQSELESDRALSKLME
jgi:transcriptional regulator